MRCKDIERLIVDTSEGGLSQEEIRGIDQHVSSCAKCTRFQEELKGIRVCLKNTSVPDLPDALVQRTRELCYEEIRSFAAAQKVGDCTGNHSIPKLIWTAIASLIVSTGLLLLPLIRDLELEQTFSFPAVVVLFLIIQNAAMLFFTPVIIQKFRSQNHHLGSA